MAGKGEMHMLSAALLLLANSLFLTLRLTGDTGSFPKPLSAGEERMYLERSLAGDLEARNILVEHNLRLVAHIIKKYYTQAAEQEDLISIGTIGLIKAVDTFRPERKIRLATYASRCVERGIDVKSLSEMLGHADVRTTLQVYVHSSLEHKMRVIQSICFLAPALAEEFAPSPSPSVFPETLQYQQLLAALSQMG